jgi:hypothetical protein
MHHAHVRLKSERAELDSSIAEVEILAMCLTEPFVEAA